MSNESYELLANSYDEYRESAMKYIFYGTILKSLLILNAADLKCER